MCKRIPQLDFLKGIFILHVIMIHLVYLGQCHPNFKQFMLFYTTPAFFIISGYLAHVNKPAKPFFRKVLWWFIPYAIMESAYIVMAAFLPIKEHIDHLTFSTFCHHLFISPLGPYWYIHDLILCYLAYYALNKGLKKYHDAVVLLVSAILIYVFSYLLEVVLLQSCCFFALGIIINHRSKDFVQIFHPSWITIPLIVLLFFFHDYFEVPTMLKHFVLSLLLISAFLYIYPFLPSKIAEVMGMIGRNTLSILLFSPIFTIITKLFVKYLSFDSSAVLFTLVSVIFVAIGSLTVTYIMDKLHISQYFFGEKKYFKGLPKNL